jgi:hypothetical protein
MYYTVILLSPSAHFIASSYNELTKVLVEDNYDNFRLTPTTENFCSKPNEELPNKELPNEELPVVTKEHAKDSMIAYADYYKSKYNSTPTIDYNGNTFYFDINAIQSTQNMCLDMNDTDNIPTPGGQWKTVDVDGNGNPVYVTMTVSEFKDFTKHCYDRGANNFFNKESHTLNINSIYNDDTKTIDDIFNYDVSTGWTL